MGWRSLGVLCVALLGVRSAGAAAPDPSRVAFSDCESEPLGKQAFLGALALELGRGSLRESAPESAAIVVSYRCDGIAVLQVYGARGKVSRELRTDDVTLKERARVLALSVAELARAGEEPDAARDEASLNEEAASTSTVEKSPDPAKQDQPQRQPLKAPPGRVARDEARASQVSAISPSAPRSFAHLTGGLRFKTDVERFYYGAALGLEIHGFRLQLEGFGAHATTSRGSIASGLLAVRLGHTLPLARFRGVETGLVASAAAGVNWALGSSDVPGTLARRVVMPYADARVGVWATTEGRIPFTPLCELYAGRAAGIIANVDSDATLATGGWFTGIDLGLWL